MAMRPRHEWVAARVATAFDLAPEEATGFVRRNVARLDAMFELKEPKLFVFYQSAEDESKSAGEEAKEDEAGESKDDAAAAAGGAAPGAPAELCLSNGEDVAMRGKALFLLPNTANGRPVDPDKGNDGTLLVGEIVEDPLPLLKAQLQTIYKGSIGTQATQGIEDAHLTAFERELDRFSTGIDEAVQSRTMAVALQKVPTKYDLDKLHQQAHARSRRSPDFDSAMVSEFMELVRSWMARIEKELQDTDTSSMGPTAGPRHVLEWWRRRMQKLTSITEQLRQRDCSTVIMVLSMVVKSSHVDRYPAGVPAVMRRWKNINMDITEAANEAKDNVKYLYTLEKFIEPLYSGSPVTIVDALPALLNSIKMIHSIARYFSTTERMTDLFAKVTAQMINNCRAWVTGCDTAETRDDLWRKRPELIVARMRDCMELNRAYQETYRAIKEKLEANPRHKQFDFPEQAIFARFDLFCRRAAKLAHMFSTMGQFGALKEHGLEGMEAVLKRFDLIVRGMQAKHKSPQLLAFAENAFDRDFVEFNVRINELEGMLQDFINEAFSQVSSIDASLALLAKFRGIFTRPALAADLNEKLHYIFRLYGEELERVQRLYEEQKHNPPKPRNMAPVAGNMMWARHLYKRIEGPMRVFEADTSVLQGKDAKKIVKTYNRVARTLVTFEMLWYKAWTESIEAAKAGLQATLVIRHPDDGKLYVNFDPEILQLIREAKCLHRMGVVIPESARMVLLQEDKFKQYFNDLSFILREYTRVTDRIIPVTRALMQPALEDLEFRLRPGMVTLTWTSMNIDAYKGHVLAGLHRLDELVTNVNDIIENRIEKNLKVVSQTLLVDMPDNQSFTLEEFVDLQTAHIETQASVLRSKNLEVRAAVDDLLQLISSYVIDVHIAPVADPDICKLYAHYNHYMYSALLNSTKASLNALKKRVTSRGATSSVITLYRPFFELDVQLSIPKVRLSPSLDDVQAAINRTATAVLRCSKALPDWGALEPAVLVERKEAEEEARRLAAEEEAAVRAEQDGAASIGASAPAGVSPLRTLRRKKRKARVPDRSFFERITKDIEIVRVVLLLTGSVQGTREQVARHLDSFAQYDWLWKQDAEEKYAEFAATHPGIDDYERELQQFLAVERDITALPQATAIGALSLRTAAIKKQLSKETQSWMHRYADNLHKLARGKMMDLAEYMKGTTGQLSARKPESLASLANVMRLLHDVRARQSGISGEITPILEMYAMIERYGIEADEEELDTKSVLWVNWKKLIESADHATDAISALQVQFRTDLLQKIKEFKLDEKKFSKDYKSQGPTVKGLAPSVAMERLKRFEDEFEMRERRRELYQGGERLFALPVSEYATLAAIGKELTRLAKLYSLYRDVEAAMSEWKGMLWSEAVAAVETMSESMATFESRCTKLPKQLRDFEAFEILKQRIEDFQLVLPLLQELSKPTIEPRHWERIQEITSHELHPYDPEFRLKDLLEAPIVEHHEEVEEVTDAADKEAKSEAGLVEVEDIWQVREFNFMPWKGRGINILMAERGVIEELEEAQMTLQTLLASKYILPFKERASSLLQELGDTSSVLRKWAKVQQAWCSLESVFLSGDIAKQMPIVAKKFVKVDKDFGGLMHSANETPNVVVACRSEVLRSMLPLMDEELQFCQNKLDRYLEQKRHKFPRFFFVSDALLLELLSKGSDLDAVQRYYENVFAAVTRVDHAKEEKTSIIGIRNLFKGSWEEVELENPVTATGNIEDWLNDLLGESKYTMKRHGADAAASIAALEDIEGGGLRAFVDSQLGQYSLLGIQLLWTADVERALETMKTRRTAMSEAQSRTSRILSTMSQWTLQVISDKWKANSKMLRTKIETLITIQVHQVDILDYIAKNVKGKNALIRGPDDFEWLKQCRFYWDEDGEDEVDDEGRTRISVTDVNFSYQYEYLGVKDRLVITPLTDRCYITLSQALGMYLGGAPAGPAGTGKTETVKDMGNTLGIYVIVTNCSDQHRSRDCAKIFKGLSESGLWGCFDEFNRITLPVLSVVAQQVQSINDAKRASKKKFDFLGEDIPLNPVCGYFITMNPGYAGRQELPENLKILFRGVTMMVPDREIIIRVKLCAYGYGGFNHLASKFFTCYKLCEQQLSKQKHYDFGLRNILSVLRTASATKRGELETSEEILLWRTLRDMNLSKLVAQDVPLFVQMLRDIFPGLPEPKPKDKVELQGAMQRSAESFGLTWHKHWVLKVNQFYDTILVRHGIMLVGPTGGGKTMISKVLAGAMAEMDGHDYKQIRLNPKAVEAKELYGYEDPRSGEWVQGVFSAIWKNFNDTDKPYHTWIIEDGPVDTLWIESLNTVLDDNRILTLSNGDRINMTDNVKIMFENETLANASPATVSRAGIVYVSEEDLDWHPVCKAWIERQDDAARPVVRDILSRLVGDVDKDIEDKTDPGHAFRHLIRNADQVMTLSRVGVMSGFFNLLDILRARAKAASDQGTGALCQDPANPDYALHWERLMVFCTTWTVGGLLEPDDRRTFDAYLREHATPSALPEAADDRTVYEMVVDIRTLNWGPWRPPVWEYPEEQEPLDFSNLLVPNMDTTRSIYVLEALHSKGWPVLMLGGPGTAKTSTALMFVSEFDPAQRQVKRINFSSATTPRMLQDALEASLEKRGGRTFGPPAGKALTIFIDDLSMPEINEWGDQPTNELTRQVVEDGGLYFLEKDMRGEFKKIEGVTYIAAMKHPGGGRNDIPARLKRQWFTFNLVLPDMLSIDDLYGQMLRGRFDEETFDDNIQSVVNRLTSATIALWSLAKRKMLPTPSKFHYIFNMRELSRVFQGILLTPKDTILTGGSQVPAEDGRVTLLRLWKHECARVFEDKLTNNPDKDWFKGALEETTVEQFGEELAAAVRDEILFVDFFRDDVYDEDEVLVEMAPKVYECGGTLENVRSRVQGFMDKQNLDQPATPLKLVLFDDALRHLVRISRIIEMPRGSALLVGVGGSGKQSLTRLAAYIARQVLFQITLKKGYNTAALREDLKKVYDIAGHERKPVTFLFTDAEIKEEDFLEFVNSILMTGEVPNLFPKDELMAILGDIQGFFVKDRPDLDETTDNLRQYFIDTVRDNLHLVLCMSPVNPKFPERARKFPGLISSTTIDWFLPWPQEALIAVSRGLLGNFEIDADEETKEQVMMHMGTVHAMVVDVCEEYYTSLRRRVYQTPKSYLSFIGNYSSTYLKKLKGVQAQASNINRGLDKLVQGAEEVEKLKGVLATEKVKLEAANKKVNEFLQRLTVDRAEAEKKGEAVQAFAEECQAKKESIEETKAFCESELAKAMPIVEEANAAIDKITPGDIAFVKKLPKPADIIRIVLDGVQVLLMKPTLEKVKPGTVEVKPVGGDKQTWQIWSLSWDGSTGLLADSGFLGAIQNFDKDALNEETVELVSAYVDLPYFEAKVAAGAAGAAEGLCIWVGAMKRYFFASREVKPKQAALAVAEGQLQAALEELGEAEQQLAAVKERLADLQRQYDEQVREKNILEEGAAKLQAKMEKAEKLIKGLAGERQRWTQDSRAFADQQRRLVGDVALGCAFISYCGPFNSQFREYLLNDKFTADLKERKVPVTGGLDVIEFLENANTIGDWNLQGLPSDPLSIQNGILVTRSERYPLLIDPQGQAQTWIVNRARAAELLPPAPWPEVTELNSSKLKDTLEQCMQMGYSLVVVKVEEELDPLLDPVLEKRIIKKGRRMVISVADSEMDFDPNFRLFFLTRLPNPHFSPELQAKTTVVDFTVTMKGLEDQLLGVVIKREQRALEEQLAQVLEQVNTNRKQLAEYNDVLLKQLSGGDGNLLEQEGLVETLAIIKEKVEDVATKLESAQETKATIDEQREQYRPVAIRGSVLYFSVVDMSLVNVMYQTSLDQFLGLFHRAITEAPKNKLTNKRVENIIDKATYVCYRYVNKGLYEKHKLLYVFILTVKVLVRAHILEQHQVGLFLRGGAALDPAKVRRRPDWMKDEAAWLNAVALSEALPFFRALPDNIFRSEPQWRTWFESNEPENTPIPDFELPLNDNAELGPWLRLLLVRSLREDRTLLMVKQFIRNTPLMGPRYTEPVTDTIEDIFGGMTTAIPVVYLLSVGADPTKAIQDLCKRHKTSVSCISMGEGQEERARADIQAASVNGTWVLLQNCELGLDLMATMENMIKDMQEMVHEDFRLFITALPHPKFPLGLLQMSTKVTNEPPSGIQAGLQRSYTTMVTQKLLEVIDSPQHAEVWRRLVYTLCFTHSIVQERRKFGALGWCVPYEYNNGDLAACLTFLERHLYGGELSWTTVRYMVSEVQYGGKITDDMDRRLFNTYAARWLNPKVLEAEFQFNPRRTINPLPGDYTYGVYDALEVEHYRAHATEIPDVDSPEIFGLHPNADLTFRVKEARELLDGVGETQPKAAGGGGGGGKSMDEVLMEQCGQLLEQMPQPFIEDVYMSQLKELGGTGRPLNMFLMQEVQRLQAVIARVGNMLREIQLAIKGEVVMTNELVDAMGDIFQARVPKPWLVTPGGDEFSWFFPTLGTWFKSLQDRDRQNRGWLEDGRPVAFWMTGFFNPQGFLTAMKQEVARKHKTDKVPWALDSVIYFNQMKDAATLEAVREPPEEGVYVYGLILDGARWDERRKTLAESRPKEMNSALPVMHITALPANKAAEKNSMFKPKGAYECPVYRYARRTDLYLVFVAKFVTKDVSPDHWVLRGVATLCTTV